MKIPDWVRQFFLIVTGESWPEADEDQLRALARLYAELVRILAAVEEELAVIEAAIAGGVGRVMPRRRCWRG
ncbi:hypothetical protein ACFQZ4_43430 [Catellatospora coxensis]